MIFKKMSIHMSKKEIQKALSILKENAILKKYLSYQRQNAIKITFTLYGGCDNDIYSLLLLPDTIDDISNGIKINNNNMWKYQQFMVAKGYSELWLGNIFTE